LNSVALVKKSVYKLRLLDNHKPDGVGITRSLMQASISGILAANEILKRMGKEHT
jgi:hypothetical protein